MPDPRAEPAAPGLCAPGFATLNAARAVETRVIAGRAQAVAWDLAAGRRHAVTDSPHGVELCEIEPDGRFVWWFDADTAGEGLWRRQPFAGGEPVPALVGVPAGRAYGIGFDHAGSLAAVSVGVDGGSRCYAGAPAREARLVVSAPGYLCLVDIAPDGALMALAGRPDGPDAVVLCRPDGDGDAILLAGGREQRLWPMEFAPAGAAEAELLLVVERDERYTIATWRPSEGIRPGPWPPFDTEISVRWFQRGPASRDRRVLIQQDRAGRSRLLLGRPGRPELDEVPTPPGTILSLSCTPDGTVHYLWSRTGTPSRPLTVRPGRPADAAEATATPSTAPDLWTPRPYGPVHSFVTTPAGDGPWPTIFLVHGGPATHDRDCHDPRVDLLTGAGCAVVRTNYRGSTGYGPRWRRDFGHRVGLAQLEDLAAVREHLVRDGVARDGRIGLCGASWGGYLTLLALGVQPDLWSLGMAAQPIADYPAAHRGTTPALRDADRELFGGGPEQVPERYRAASPLTYADAVRGPVLIVASATDERCPPGQIERYVRALRRAAVPHEVAWVGGGHNSRSSADHASVLATMAGFLRRAWPALAMHTSDDRGGIA